MSLEKFKESADLSAEYKKLKVDYEAKKVEVKDAQLNHMKTAFTDYFNNAPGFTVVNTVDNGVEAKYNDKSIKLIPSKGENPTIFVNAELIVDKDVHGCTTVLRTELPSSMPDKERQKLRETEAGRLQDDVASFKNFIADGGNYEFNYRIKGQKESFKDFNEALKTIFG